MSVELTIETVTETVVLEVQDHVPAIVTIDTIPDLREELDDRVDKVAGYSLVADDEIAKLLTVEQDAQKNTVSSVAGKQDDVLLDKSDVGLGSVDNTADADKPVSTAVADALDDKADKADVRGIASDSSEPLEVHLDKNGQVYQYTDSAGNMFLSGLSGSVQERLSATVDEGSLNKLIYQNALTLRYEKKKTLTPVATKAEDGLIKRMPSGIITPTGMVYFYHKQIAGFNGDGQGSELWKALVAIDDQLNVTVTSRELFLAPDEPRGIVKHPMLGRTSDGRILLMFEKRLETSDAYTRYQCLSSDEGETFSTPVVVSPSGVNPSALSALGTTGTIVTARNGRLVVPMYTVGGGTCYCIFSDDDGESWVFSNWLAVVGFEPSISLDMDDNLVMDIRPRPGMPSFRVRAISRDNGVNWSLVDGFQAIPSAHSQGVVFRDEAIGLMIQAQPTNDSGPRDKYQLFLSYDNLKTAPFVYQPFPDEWYGGYSQLLKWRDGVYLINIEYAESFTQLNIEENSGILVLSLQEVISNVSPY